ncbi:MAG: methylated-DNA--[protein]-cysteine S-methyltransferase [Acidimicrobiia bacterium]|nr:methylated-DNA--[protein]-cysteine S-methyltransferase [Acidimicrobiia bacterium]
MSRRRRHRTPDPVFISLFDTAFGRCGIGYTDRLIVAVQLPEATPEATLRRLAARLPAAVDRPEIPVGSVAADAVERIQALLAGEPADLDPVPVDVSSSSAFNQSVYEVVRRIPPGEVLTYGEVARRVGEPGGAQAVGRAMGANPIPIIIPCHRVIGANRDMVGFSANGGVETKRRMLVVEGCPDVPPTLFDEL